MSDQKKVSTWSRTLKLDSVSFFLLFFFYIIGIPCKAEKALQGMELQEKETQKD